MVGLHVLLSSTTILSKMRHCCQLQPDTFHEVKGVWLEQH